MTVREKVQLADKFAQFTETWSPKIVGETNGQYNQTGQTGRRVRVARP